MSWTAKVVFLSPPSDAREVVVEFSDGVGKPFTKRFATDGTQAQLRLRVLDTIASLDARKTVDLAEGLTIDTTPIAAPVPTQDELDRAAFVRAYRTLVTLQRGVSAGLIAANDTRVANARASAVAAFKAGYEGLL